MSSVCPRLIDSIQVPAAFADLDNDTLLDDLPEAIRRRAITYLIECLPKISTIKSSLEAGTKLSDLSNKGSIGILRWVIGSCRAYLRETKYGEGVLNAITDATDARPSHSYNGQIGAFKQFSFVVGSPEQEMRFKEEIEVAKRSNTNIALHPTILAFHGWLTEI
jgi:ubiquitin-conjugating enzyme E2 Q